MEKPADSVVQVVGRAPVCVSAEPTFLPANDLAEFPNATEQGSRS